MSVLFFENILLSTPLLLLMPPLDRGTLLMSERTALRFLDFIRQLGFQMAGMIAASYCSTICLIRSRPRAESVLSRVALRISPVFFTSPLRE